MSGVSASGAQLPEAGDACQPTLPVMPTATSISLRPRDSSVTSSSLDHALVGMSDTWLDDEVAVLGVREPHFGWLRDREVRWHFAQHAHETTRELDRLAARHFAFGRALEERLE